MVVGAIVERVDARWPDRLRSVPPELVLVLATGAALRLFRLGHEYANQDELYSIAQVRRLSVPALLFEHSLVDPHPPLYYLLLKGWIGAFGPSVASVRFQSTLYGVAAIAVVYYLGRALYTRQAATVASLLVGVSLYLITFSRTARMYSLLFLLTALSYYLLVELTRDNTRPRAIAYVAVTVLLGYTHTFGLFVILAQALYLGGRALVGGEELALEPRRWLTLHGAVGVLLAPWVVVLAGRAIALESRQCSAISWIREPEVGRLWDYFLQFSFVTDVFQYHGTTAPASIALVALAALALVPLRRDWHERIVADPARETGDRRAASTSGDRAGRRRWPLADDLSSSALLALLLLVPILVPFAISKLFLPILIPRAIVPASLGFYLLLGRGIEAVPTPPARILVVVLLVATASVPFQEYYGERQLPGQVPDFQIEQMVEQENPWCDDRRAALTPPRRAQPMVVSVVVHPFATGTG